MNVDIGILNAAEISSNTKMLYEFLCSMEEAGNVANIRQSREEDTLGKKL